MKKTPTLFMLSVPAALAVACALALTGATLPCVAICALALPSASPADTPDAYLDYVESTGSQWIDTGVVGADGLRMEAEMEWTALTAAGENQFCGATTVVDSRNVEYVPYLAYQAASHRMRYNKAGAASVQGGAKPVTGVRYHVVVSMDDGAQTNIIRRCEGGSMARIYTRGDSFASDFRALTGPVDTQLSLYLFAGNFDGTANQFASARLYSLKFWRKDDNGEYRLVRHFIPCHANGHAALYDKVDGIIYSAQGGALVAGPVLPRPAELVEWVQSDGAAGSRGLYIDTGALAKAGTGMTSEMEWAVKPAGYGVDNIFCGATSSAGKRFWLYDAVADSASANATHRFGYNGWKLQLQSNSVVNVATRYRVDAAFARGSQRLSVTALDGSGTGANRSNNDLDSAATDTEQALFLFANNNAGTATNLVAARLYSLVLTNEFGVVRDFVPCVADNGRAGLFDRISECVFFPQAAVADATADFDFASEVGGVTNVPATTKWPLFRPEWIEANGTNDYVNLGVVARDGTRMLAEVEWNAIPAAATFCGAATNSTHGLFSTYRVTSDFHRMGYYNGSSTLGGANCAPATGVRYRVETSLASGDQIITVAKQENGAWVPVGAGTRTANLSFPAGYGNLGLPLYLFARNFSGVPDEFAPARLYSFKLWQGGALVRDLCPAFDPADNAPALFDKVTERYFRNNGGYRLTAGGATSAFPGAGTIWILK